MSNDKKICTTFTEMFSSVNLNLKFQILPLLVCTKYIFVAAEEVEEKQLHFQQVNWFNSYLHAPEHLNRIYCLSLVSIEAFLVSDLD